MLAINQVLEFIEKNPGAGYLEIAQACDLRLKIVHMLCTVLERQGRIKGRDAGYSTIEEDSK